MAGTTATQARMHRAHAAEAGQRPQQQSYLNEGQKLRRRRRVVRAPANRGEFPGTVHPFRPT